MKTLCMAHYQQVYGEVTQPSDKPTVNDLELETHAATEAQDFAGFKNSTERNNMSILKQSYFCGLQHV